MVARRINFNPHSLPPPPCLSLALSFSRALGSRAQESPVRQLFLPFRGNLIVRCKAWLIVEDRRSLKMARGP